MTHPNRTIAYRLVSRLWIALFLLSSVASGNNGCYDSTRDVLEHLATIPDQASANIKLCQDYIFSIGTQISDFDASSLNLTEILASFQGEPPLVARPHTHYKCGPTGWSGGNCVLRGGTIQFLGIGAAEAIHDVTVEGLTFESAKDVAILLEQKGSIEFMDCIIQNHLDGASPVILSYTNLQRRSLFQSKHNVASQGIRRLPPNDGRLDVSFFDTAFVGNKMANISDAFTYGLVTAFTPFHIMQFENCQFLDNHYEDDERGYLIRSFGSEFSLLGSSFSGNTVSGWGLIELFSWDLEEDYPTISNNYGSSAQDATSFCPFVALSETIPERPRNVICLDVNGVNAPISVPPAASPVYESPVYASPVSVPSGDLDCYNSTRSVFETLLTWTPNFPIEITLCPFTIYSIGRWDDANSEWVDGDPPLLARNNTNYICGEDGSSSNQCTLRHGATQLWGPTMSDGRSSFVVNFEVRGITFEGATDTAILLDSGGEISFIDCIFQYQTTGVPVLSTFSVLPRERNLRVPLVALTEQQERKLLQPSNTQNGDTLELSFVNSQFRYNDLVSDAFASGLITLSTEYQNLTILNCRFAYNNANEAERGYLVRSFGSSVTIENSLFSNNFVSGWGLIELFSFDSEDFSFISNTMDSYPLTETDWCPFAAFSETIPERARQVSCFDTDGDEYIPSTPIAPVSPVVPPAEAPVATPDCYNSTRDVRADILSSHPSTPLTITLCPDTVFAIGRWDESSEDWIDGDPPLYARSKTRYTCGKEGSSDNQCVLTNGFAQFIGTPSENGLSSMAEDVVVKGLTFDNATDVAIMLDVAGKISFIDCIIKNNVDAVPVLSSFSALPRALRKSDGATQLRVNGERALWPPGWRNQQKLQLTFRESKFVGNTQTRESGFFTNGLITVSTPFHELSVEKTIFEGNSYDEDIRGYLIRSYGGPVSITASSFSDNNVSGWGLVELFSMDSDSMDEDLSIEGNSGTLADNSTNACPFVAYSETIPERIRNIQCVGLDGEVFEPVGEAPYFSTPVVSPILPPVYP